MEMYIIAPTLKLCIYIVSCPTSSVSDADLIREAGMHGCGVDVKTLLSYHP